MAKITWLGDENEANTITWHGINFNKGETLETLDLALAEKAALNKYFKVEDIEPLRKAAADRKKAEEKGLEAKAPEPKPQTRATDTVSSGAKR